MFFIVCEVTEREKSDFSGMRQSSCCLMPLTRRPHCDVSRIWVGLISFERTIKPPYRCAFGYKCADDSDSAENRGSGGQAPICGQLSP